MIFVNGDLDLQFQGQMIGHFIAGRVAIIVVKKMLRIGLWIAEIKAKL